MAVPEVVEDPAEGSSFSMLFYNLAPAIILDCRGLFCSINREFTRPLLKLFDDIVQHAEKTWNGFRRYAFA